MKTIRLSAIALLAMALLAPSPADARPWAVRELATQGPAFSRGVDVLPTGRAAVLLQRGGGASSRLELRVGGRTRLLDTGAHPFGSTEVQHDSRGRMVVAWRRVIGGTTQVFVWTAKGGRQQVSAVRKGVSHVSLSVAASGRAALVFWSPEGIFVARGAAGHGFSAATAVAPAGTFDAPPGVGVASGGRLVVAWSDGRRILARAANGPGPLGSVQAVALRAPSAGSTLVAGAPKVVMTTGSRAVVAVSSSELRGGPPASIADRRVEAFEWPLAAAHPSAAATFSRGAAAGDADLIAQGTSALIAWTERPQGAARALWVIRWTPKGLQRPNLYDTRALRLPVLLTVAPKGAVDVFYVAGGQRWFTVRLASTGLYGGTATVTPPGEKVPLIDVAAEGSRAIAGWTAGKRSVRVQVARPAA
jgi:hypothetical protein